MGRLEINHGPVALNRRAARFGRKINHQLSEGFRGITGGTGPDVYIDWRKFSQGLDPRKDPLLYSMFAITVLSLMTIPTMALVDDVGDHHDGIGTNMHPQYAEKSAANDNAPPVISELPHKTIISTMAGQAVNTLNLGNNNGFFPFSPDQAKASEPTGEERKIEFENSDGRRLILTVSSSDGAMIQNMIEEGVDIQEGKKHDDGIYDFTVAISSEDTGRLDWLNGHGFQVQVNESLTSQASENPLFQAGEGIYEKGVLLLQLNDINDLDTIRKLPGVEGTEKIGTMTMGDLNLIKIILTEKTSFATASFYKKLKSVDFSQTVKNVSFRFFIDDESFQRMPNDPLLADPANRWHLEATNMPEAWNEVTGVVDTLIAVIDGGFDTNHEDLHFSPLSRDIGMGDPNPGIPNCSASPDAQEHGTIVAGVLNATGDNGKGTAGTILEGNVAWLKVTHESLGLVCTLGIDDIVNALDYAKSIDAKVVNLSMDIGHFANQDTIDIFQAAVHAFTHDENGNLVKLIVIAAANNEGDIDIPDWPRTACEISRNEPGVICTTSTGQRDDGTEVFAGELYSGIGYGKNTVQIAAPGIDVATTAIGSRYMRGGGNSYAAPQVAAIIAYIIDKAPSLPMEKVKAILLTTVDKLPSLRGKVASDGRLNGERAIKKAIECAQQGTCYLYQNMLPIILKTEPPPPPEEHQLEFPNGDFEQNFAYWVEVHPDRSRIVTPPDGDKAAQLHELRGDTDGQIIHSTLVRPNDYDSRLHVDMEFRWPPVAITADKQAASVNPVFLVGFIYYPDSTEEKEIIRIQRPEDPGNNPPFWKLEFDIQKEKVGENRKYYIGFKIEGEYSYYAVQLDNFTAVSE